MPKMKAGGKIECGDDRMRNQRFNLAGVTTIKSFGIGEICHAERSDMEGGCAGGRSRGQRKD